MVRCAARLSAPVSAAFLVACTDVWGIDQPMLEKTDVASECGEFGELRCHGERALQTCNNILRWETERTCDFLCRAAQCVGECRPGSRRCDGEESVQECDGGGQYRTVESCSEQTCLAGECTGECAAGDARCSTEGRIVCSAAGHWEARRCLSSACVDGACIGNCVPGDLACGEDATQPNQRLLCNELGEWVPAEGMSCAEQTCVGEGICAGSCVRGELACDDDANALLKCNALGAWELEEACNGQTCVADQCGGDCEDGAFRCEPTASTSGVRRRRQHCVKGDWETTPECDYLCDPAACADERACCDGECTPTATECIDEVTLNECQSDATWLEIDCGDHACRSDTQQCGGDCRPHSQRCALGDIESCSAEGVWTAAVECDAPNETCKLDTSAPVCGDNPISAIGVMQAPAAFPDAFLGDTLYLTRVETSTEPAALMAFVAETPPDVAAAVIMALYDDDSGKPGALLYATEQAPFGPGQMAIDVASLECVLLEAKAAYWVGLQLSAPTPWAFVANEAGVFRSIGWSFADGFPDEVIATAVTVYGQSLPVALRLRTAFDCDW